MRAAKIKTQALRTLALRKDPKRKNQLQVAQKSHDWLTKTQFEKTLTHLEKANR
jgi:hypothetical protein